MGVSTASPAPLTPSRLGGLSACCASLSKPMQADAGLLLLLACAAVFRAVDALDMQCETATAEETSPGKSAVSGCWANERLQPVAPSASNTAADDDAASKAQCRQGGRLLLRALLAMIHLQ
jgi:hypothetical protein